ncbi:MAG TPA: DNA repair protein RecN [Spirochaetia bacterium]|nr:DNA repair protein RecN [Spirochaetia bacterium]
MIQELTITNYALIEKVKVGFAPGLNVLTGETGAGKSILIGALGLLLGSKADAEVIRSGAEEAQVTGVFEAEPSLDATEWLVANDLSWPADEPLILKRTVRPQKRGGCSVSGQPVTRAQLEELTGFLVDLHGQHEHQSLFTADQHRRLLDRYAGLEPDLKVFAGEFQTLSQAKKDLEELVAGEADREAELFRLHQVVQDIEKASPREDEEDELKAERSRLEQFGKLSEALGTLESSLTEGRSSAVAQLKTARQALGAVTTVDDRWSSEENRLENALFEVEDIAQTLHRYRLGLSFSPERLEDVNERLAILHGLDKRYGPGFAAVQKTLADAKERRDRLENFTSEREKAEARVNSLEQALIQSALKLSERRQDAALLLETGVKAALGDLGMRGAVFKIGFQRRIADSGKPVCTPYGLDQIEFLLAANLGESPKLLRETASGGELSRVMLALKTLLSEADKIPILIFDEIDTGIGGEIGLALGKYLKRLSRTKQVLCITHLASIASFADHHLRVEKSTEGGRTTTGVSVVEGEERVREVARMLSGNTVSEASLQHAKELIGRHGVQG